MEICSEIRHVKTSANWKITKDNVAVVQATAGFFKETPEREKEPNLMGEDSLTT